jgi:hypothetical protein
LGRVPMIYGMQRSTASPPSCRPPQPQPGCRNLLR